MIVLQALMLAAVLAAALLKLAMPSYTAKQTVTRVKVDQPFQLRLSTTPGTGYNRQPQGPKN